MHCSNYNCHPHPFSLTDEVEFLRGGGILVQTEQTVEFKFKKSSMPISTWIRRFLLRLIRDPAFLLALLLTCVTIGPFAILGFFIETPNWTYWFEILSLILQSNLAHFGIGVLVAFFSYNLVKTTVAETLKTLQQKWFSARSKFDTFVWDVECALEQEKGKAIGKQCSHN